MDISETLLFLLPSEDGIDAAFSYFPCHVSVLLDCSPSQKLRRASNERTGSLHQSSAFQFCSSCKQGSF